MGIYAVPNARAALHGPNKLIRGLRSVMVELFRMQVRLSFPINWLLKMNIIAYITPTQVKPPNQR